MDASGAVVNQATIRLTNEATAITTAVRTGEHGQYSAPALKPGVYTIIAEAPGFKALVQSGVALHVNQAVRLDMQLEIGNPAERVTVTSETPLLETETSGQGLVIDGRKIVELPLNGRDYNQLATLSPGLCSPRPGSRASDSRAPST